MKLNQVTVPVTDIDAAINFYSETGLKLIVQAPHYARFIVPGNDATFSVHKTDEKAGSHTVIYFECENIDEKVAELQGKGFAFDKLPTNQPWLWREAYITDPFGNRLCFYHAGENRLNPPWRIKE